MKYRVVYALVVLTLLPVTVSASDHADPALSPPPFQEAGLTGLFAFPDGERFVLIMNVRRGLSTPKPYEVDRYEYAIHIDLDSKVTFDNEADLRRYGGTVAEPSKIEEDVTIKFRLTDEAKMVRGYPAIGGLDLGGIQVDSHPTVDRASVHDDPFIFPRFEGKNVIAMVVSIPLSVFPPAHRNWLIWGTSTKRDSDKIVDHVGRSNRTQLGRLDFVNTLHPKDQQAAIQSRLDRGQKVQAGLAHLMGHVPRLGSAQGLFEYVLQVRPYDPIPDVMIYSRDRAPGFPNGRLLTDDVAGLTCQMGDCVLQEIAFKEGGYPRKVKNDVELPGRFPYLADPHPVHKEKEEVDRCALVFWLILLILLAVWIIYKLRKSKWSERPFERTYYPRLIDR